jgi:DNA/RNA endonuclease YhcR with UshA esterase domain
MTHRRLWTTVFGVALAALVSMPALAQKGAGGPKGSPRYDPKTEVTVKGTVEEVKEYPSRSGWRTGQHVTLKTEQGSLDVHLGPTEYWKKNGFHLAKGDSIEVTGSKSNVDGAEVVLARQVKQGERAVTLRSAQGVPAWSRGRRSP